MAAKTGICSICGAYGPLSFEHVPPEAAFNSDRVLLANTRALLENPAWDYFEKPKGKYQQRGAGGDTLCVKCNSTTGHWYGNQYVSWARQGMQHLWSFPDGSSLRLPYYILPLRTMKQIVCMFASACGPGLFEAHPDLRRFVLNRFQTGIPDKIKIYCYYLSPKSRSTRQSGIQGVMRDGRNYIFSEISHPPFGLILAVDSPPIDPELADITFFAKEPFHEFKDFYLKIPTREVNIYLPGDFRPFNEIRANYDANVAMMEQ